MSIHAWDLRKFIINLTVLRLALLSGNRILNIIIIIIIIILIISVIISDSKDFSLSYARDRREKNHKLFLYRAQNFQTRRLNTADPKSMQYLH